MKKIVLCVFFISCITAVHSWAVSSDEEMPWDTPLEKIKDALTGNTVKVIGMILIAGAGIMLAASDGGTAKQKIFFIILGIGVAMNAPSILQKLFGQGSGVLFP